MQTLYVGITCLGNGKTKAYPSGICVNNVSFKFRSVNGNTENFFCFVDDNRSDFRVPISCLVQRPTLRGLIHRIGSKL
jgi:hypothetical protein